MWESASPQPPQEAKPAAKPRREKSGEDLVLWAQLFLCGLVLAGVYCAKRFQLPVYAALRTTYEAALQEQGPGFLDSERNFLKFAEQTAAELRQAAAEVFAELRTATPESAARPAHARAAYLPSGSSAESYQPDFPMVFPLPGRVYERTSGYGWRTDPMGGQGTDFHTGVDLAVGQGTPVLAAADGVVRFAGWHSSYGNYVRILHAGGDETIYAHMQYLFVRTGQRVTAGETLGTVGATGNATGPHLHFELLHKGTRYDPSEALEGAA